MRRYSDDRSRQTQWPFYQDWNHCYVSYLFITILPARVVLILLFVTNSYTCDQGYTLVGKADVNCQTNAQWSTAPFCYPN